MLPFCWKKYLSGFLLLLVFIKGQNFQTVFNGSHDLSIFEDENNFEVSIVYSFKGKIKSRRFERLRKKAELDALETIGSYIYVNTVFPDNRNIKKHLNHFISAIATIKPFKVESRISNLKTVSFKRVNKSTVKAIFLLSKDNIKLKEVSPQSLANVPMVEIIRDAIEKGNRSKELKLWLLDLESNYQNRKQIISTLPLLSLKENNELEKTAFKKVLLNETIINVMTGEILELEKKKYVDEGIQYLKEYDRKNFYTYSNILISELLKYDIKIDQLLNMYLSNLSLTEDQLWSNIIKHVYKNRIQTEFFLKDSLLIADIVNKSIGLLNLENEQFSNEFKDEYNKGIQSFKKNNIDEALGYFLKSLEQESISADVLNFIGACYRIKKETKYALPFLVQCLELDPKHKYAWGNLGICLANEGYDNTDGYNYMMKMASNDKWSKFQINDILKKK